jgi:hypothetical protein
MERPYPCGGAPATGMSAAQEYRRAARSDDARMRQVSAQWQTAAGPTSCVEEGSDLEAHSMRS